MPRRIETPHLYNLPHQARDVRKEILPTLPLQVHYYSWSYSLAKEMAEQSPNKIFGFHWCPDPTLGEPVDKSRKNGVKGLMTEEGLHFIKIYVRNNNVSFQNVCSYVRIQSTVQAIRTSLESDHTIWHLAFAEAMYQRPGCAVCWLGRWPLKARVFLLLGKDSEIILYNGSESVERGKDEFDTYTIPEKVLTSKI